MRHQILTEQFGGLEGLKFIVAQIQDIRFVLGKPLDIFGFRVGFDGGRVQGDDPWIIIFHAIDGARAETEHDPEHAGFRVHALLPDEGIVGQADTRQTGKEITVAVRTGNALHQKRHLFILLRHPALQPVGERVLVHRGGEDFADGFLEMPVAFLRRSLVDAEIAFVFSGKGVAEGVFQKRTGADDDRRLAEIFQHELELLLDLVGKRAVQHLLFELTRDAKISFIGFLRHQQFPPAVLHHVRIENIRTDIEGIMDFHHGAPVKRRILAQNVAGQQHADGFAADEPRADKALLDLHQVFQLEVFPDQREDSFFPADHHTGKDFHHVLLFRGRVGISQ